MNLFWFLTIWCQLDDCLTTGWRQSDNCLMNSFYFDMRASDSKANENPISRSLSMYTTIESLYRQRDSLQKFITLHKARSLYLWGWCRMVVEIELLPRGWPNGVPSMPKNLKKVQIYPNLVITLLDVNRLTFHSLHYIVLALCKAARPAQIKEKIKILL